jgi:hypothetical protein
VRNKPSQGIYLQKHCENLNFFVPALLQSILHLGYLKIKAFAETGSYSSLPGRRIFVVDTFVLVLS